jgi:hypothetical protein
MWSWKRSRGRLVIHLVVHHSKTADTHSEDLSKLFNPVFDPEPTMNRRFIEQKRTPDAARQAAVLARHRRIDRLAAGDGYRSILFRCPSSTARSAFRHNRYGPIRWL